MPIYEYRCRNCNTQFEMIVNTSERDKAVKCKSCGSPNTGKIISASSLKINKGSSIPAGALSGCSSKSGFS